MAWSDPRGDLRVLLNDDPEGRFVKDKVVFPSRGGQADGTRTTFYTLEDRLVASGNQAVNAEKLSIYYASQDTQLVTKVAASGVTVTDSIRGEFDLMGLPASGVQIKASYFYREHLDNDLDVCLQQAAQQVNVGSVSEVPQPLQLAALSIAGALAHRKAAARWQQRKAEQFLLEDAPSVGEAVSAHVQFHTTQATELMAQGLELRKAYYETRLDQARTPAYGLLARTPWPWTPRR